MGSLIDLGLVVELLDFMFVGCFSKPNTMNLMSIIRTHARNLIFAILDAPASSFQSRSLIFAILDNNIHMCILTVRDVFY